MEGRSLLLFIFLLHAWKSSGQSELSFEINKFWNGTSLPADTNVTLSLKGVPDSNDIILQISAPFYDDPAPVGPKGKPFYKLWDYEVVEAFFLSNDGKYLEVEVGPHGQHIVLLLNGVRNAVRHSLHMNVTTSINGDSWTGTAVIPGDYFPPNVSKFNAYAIHGAGIDRQHWSLYPAHGLPEPDNHALKFFEPIELESLYPYRGSGKLSTIWQDALN